MSSSTATNAGIAILLVSSRDQKGLVVGVADFVTGNGGNIRRNESGTDFTGTKFLQHFEWDMDGFALSPEETRREFELLAKKLELYWALWFSDEDTGVKLHLRDDETPLYRDLDWLRATLTICKIILILLILGVVYAASQLLPVAGAIMIAGLLGYAVARPLLLSITSEEWAAVFAAPFAPLEVLFYVPFRAARGVGRWVLELPALVSAIEARRRRIGKGGISEEANRIALADASQQPLEEDSESDDADAPGS